MATNYVAPLARLLGLDFNYCACTHAVWAHYAWTTGICAHCDCKWIKDPKTNKEVTIRDTTPLEN